jgi:hypothetical protein
VSNPILRTSILASPRDDPTALRTYTPSPHYGDLSIRRAEDERRLVDIEPDRAVPLLNSASTNTAMGSTAGRPVQREPSPFRLRAYAYRPPLDARNNSRDTRSIRLFPFCEKQRTESSLRWILMWIGGGPDGPEQ